MMARPETSIKEKLPPRLARLEEIAYNFWWSWDRKARDLFRRLDPMGWSTTRHSPVLIIQAISEERLKALAKDPSFLRFYDQVVMDLDRDLKTAERWFGKTYPRIEQTIAYFSAEFGIHTSLPIYSGGLGILSGDHLKEASDLGLPFVAVGFLYEQGYFRQRIDPGGWQESSYPELIRGNCALRPILDGCGENRMVGIEVGDRTVSLGAWRADIGRVPLYLMDSDVEANLAWDRELTARLYGGDQETRIQQEILLGVGGVRILRALGISPRVWHINEGHSAFMLLERLRELTASGLEFGDALRRLHASTVFTTHTPVAAGHDVFPFYLMDKYFHRLWVSLGLSREGFMALGQTDGGHAGGFNMTALALRLAGRSNAVSRLHGDITRRMWNVLWPAVRAEDVPIGHITNGVHAPSWVGETIHALFRKHLGPDWRERQDDRTLWERVDDIPDGELWAAHMALKRKALSFIRERARQARIARSASPEQLLGAGIFLDPDALVVGFARRFATYKRACLVLRDIERFLRLAHDHDRPVQLVFAGKAHPADEPGKRLIQEICREALNPRAGGRIAFVEDYDMQLARALVQGVDVWLNTPRKPLEASGTSGMKAALNGVLNLSVPDGWWAEAYDGGNGWAIAPGRVGANEEEQDDLDAAELYRLLEEEVIPLFYERDLDGVPRGWAAMMKSSIRTAGAGFTTRRMVQEYTRGCYLPALEEAITLDGRAEEK